MKPKYRVKYWRWVNPEFGEWQRTGLMEKMAAEQYANSIREYHEMVEVYEDDDEVLPVDRRYD